VQTPRAIHGEGLVIRKRHGHLERTQADAVGRGGGAKVGGSEEVVGGVDFFSKRLVVGVAQVDDESTSEDGGCECVEHHRYLNRAPLKAGQDDDT
jgi:hypothetical protein